MEGDGEKRHVRISIALKKDRKTELKSFDMGKKESGERPSKARTNRSPQVGKDSSPLKSKDNTSRKKKNPHS